MKPFKNVLKICAALALPLWFFAACETTDEGGSSVSGDAYYGMGFDDPWYDGAYYPPDVVVVPPRPGDVPPADSILRPTHPIVYPPTVAPRPMPSIPSAPRPSFRR